MMQVELTRSQFLEWIASPTDTRLARKFSQLLSPKDGISLCWLNGDSGTQPILAVEADDLRDFLAFTTTYVGTYTPFTAFYRVVARELVEHIPSRARELPSHLRQALIGMVISDAALQSRQAGRKISELSIQACLATSSATVLSAFSRGYSPDIVLTALDRWNSVRMELSPTPPVVGMVRLEEFWSTVLSSLSGANVGVGKDSLVGKFLLSSIAGRGLASDDIWRDFAQRVPVLLGIGNFLRGTREQRVRALEAVVLELQSSSLSVRQRELIVGYITAQVAEGSFTYLPLASRFHDELPLAQLWFGLFAAMNEKSDVMTIGECLGRRVDRHVVATEDGLQIPDSDLSYEEFLLLHNEGRIVSIRTQYQSILDVELLPGVSGRFRLTRPVRVADEPDRTSDKLQRVRRIASQLLAVLNESEGRTEAATLFEDGVAPLSANKPTSKLARARKSR